MVLNWTQHKGDLGTFKVQNGALLESGDEEVLTFIFYNVNCVLFALSVLQRMTVYGFRGMKGDVWLFFCLSRKSSLNKEPRNINYPKAVCSRNYEYVEQSLCTHTTKIISKFCLLSCHRTPQQGAARTGLNHNFSTNPLNQPSWYIFV